MMHLARVTLGRACLGLDNDVGIAQARHMAQGKLIGSRVASRLLDVDRVTLIRWVKAGKIEPVERLSDTPTGAFLFNRADVEKLVRDRARAKTRDGHPKLDFAGDDPDSVAQPA